MKTKLINVLVIILTILLIISLTYHYIYTQENKLTQSKSVLLISPNDVELLQNQTDSLQKVVDSLEMEIHSQAQRFDNREKEYKETIFEYEYGINWIEKYHTNAYEDFHRMLSHKEQYSREDASENKKRLKAYEYNR
jgi:peptidoglycan hydrolase CwlO-like protein